MHNDPIAQAGHWGPSKRKRNLGTHRNAGVEVVLIQEGTVRWHVEGRVEEVPAGSVFFTLPWQEHGGVEDFEANCVLYFAVIRCDRDYDEPLPARRRFGFHRSIGMPPNLSGKLAQLLQGTARHSWPASGRIRWLVPELVAEQNRPESERSPETLQSLARLTLIELGRCVEAGKRARHGQSGSVPSTPSPRAEQRVAQFLASLESRVGEPWTLTAMADACGLARSRFTEVLKRLTGDTPIMALNRRRVALAKRLLTGTDRSITQIALDCGYQSSQYFAGVFRAYTGCSATRYRRQERNSVLLAKRGNR